MPIIDRWLDQAPQPIYLLANIFIRGKIDDKTEHDAMTGYLRSLADLKAATEAYNPDGTRVPIEGLEMFSAHILAGSSVSEMQELASRLQSLARLNRSYERKQGETEFQNWAPSAAQDVEDRERISRK
jgi:hypothetical protein